MERVLEWIIFIILEVSDKERFWDEIFSLHRLKDEKDFS